MRNSSNPIFLIGCLLLGAASGCRPWSPAGPGAPAGLDASGGTLQLLPVETPPYSARVLAGDTGMRVGPPTGWTAPVALSGWSRLRVEPIDPRDPDAWYGLDAFYFEPPPSPLRLPLLPRVAARAPYEELVDLLAEWITPFNGPVVAHWNVDTLRVRIPPLSAGAMYHDTCREAMQLWNDAFGRPFLAESTVEPFHVETTVFEETGLAFTRILQREADRSPRKLRLHLSPRWVEGSERYVRRVWMHEFAHVLGLWGHSVSLDHLANGRAVVVDGPHPEELRCLRWLYALPNGFSLATLDRSWRSPLGPGGADADSVDFEHPGEMVLEAAVEGLQCRDPGS